MIFFSGFFSVKMAKRVAGKLYLSVFDLDCIINGDKGAANVQKRTFF